MFWWTGCRWEGPKHLQDSKRHCAAYCRRSIEHFLRRRTSLGKLLLSSLIQNIQKNSIQRYSQQLTIYSSISEAVLTNYKSPISQNVECNPKHEVPFTNANNKCFKWSDSRSPQNARHFDDFLVIVSSESSCSTLEFKYVLSAVQKLGLTASDVKSIQAILGMFTNCWQFVLRDRF